VEKFDSCHRKETVCMCVEAYQGHNNKNYAEFSLCNASNVQLLPDNISFSQGAAIYVPYYTAYRALFQRLHAKAGETVLIHGASGGVRIHNYV